MKVLGRIVFDNFFNLSFKYQLQSVCLSCLFSYVMNLRVIYLIDLQESKFIHKEQVFLNIVFVNR